MIKVIIRIIMTSPRQKGSKDHPFRVSVLYYFLYVSRKLTVKR